MEDGEYFQTHAWNMMMRVGSAVATSFGIIALQVIGLMADAYHHQTASQLERPKMQGQ